MAQRLADLTHTHWDLSRLEHSLQQQLHGIKRLFAPAAMPAIARRHLATVKSHWQEAHALIAQHQLVLGNAHVAIALAEAQENKNSTTFQQHFNQLVAVGGLFVAIYSAVDVSLVQAVSKPAPPLNWVYPIRLGTAVLLTALLVTIYWFSKHFTKKKRAKRAAQRSLLLGLK